MVGFPITVWGGGLDFEITDAEASQYNADPDGFVARRLGFSRANEYYLESAEFPALHVAWMF